MAGLVIDRGHGGSDPGAVGYVKERTVAVKVGDYMVDYLEKNYKVDIMETIGTDSLNTRISKANKWGADLFVSIHFNAGGGDGYEALVYSSANKSLGQKFEKYVKSVGQNSRGVKYRPDLAVLRDTDMKAILNEIAFVDNKKDIADWDSSAELKEMGVALAKAAADWLDLPKKTTSKPSTSTSSSLKNGTKVRIKAGSTDMNTKKKYADFVYKTVYEVISVSGNRVVFGVNGKVTGATSKSNITIVSTKPKAIKVGSKVKVKKGAKDLNTKKNYADFVYKTTYTVIEISGSRVVFGLKGIATGATDKDNLTLA